MTLFVYINGVDVSSRIRLEDGLDTVTSAADGGYATSHLLVDDPDSSLTIGRYQNVIINETACTPNRMFTGYVTQANVSHDHPELGASRVWAIEVGDLNILSHLQAFHTSDAKRPQETGTARRDWLLSTTPARYFHNAGLAADFSGTFDEEDFRGKFPEDVLNSMSGDIGRIFFLYWTNTPTQVGLYWAGATDGTATSTLSLSNVLADVNNTTVFGVDPASELSIDMSQVYDEIFLTWAGGQVFLTDYDGRMPTGMHRTGVFDVSSRVGRLATAQAEAQILLDRYSGDAETITCTVILPKDKVNLIDAGMLVPTKIAHLPDYSTYVNLRVASRSVTFAEGTNEWYRVTLTLNLRGVTAVGGGGGGFPQQPTSPASYSQSGSAIANPLSSSTQTVTLGATTLATDTIVMFARDEVPGLNHHLTAPAGFTKLEETVSPTGHFYALWVGTGLTTNSITVTCDVAGERFIVGVVVLHGGQYESHTTAANGSDVNQPLPSITPNAGEAAVIVAFEAVNQAFSLNTDPSGYTERIQTVSNTGGNSTRLTAWTQAVSSTSGSYTGTATYASAVEGPAAQIVITGGGTVDPPRSGQWVFGETPTPPPGGGNTVFFTAFPYATGSLQVFVDQTDQTAAVTETDNTTGKFTLAFDPRSWETITVNYQGI